MSAERSSGGPRANILPLTTSEAFEMLRPQWAELHARTPSATFFTHPDWVSAWLRHLGAGTIPIFLAVRREDDLAGVVALDMDPAAPGLLGDPNVSDYGPIIAADGDEHLVARGLLEWLGEDMAPAATIWGLPERSPLVAGIESLAGDFGWDCRSEDEAITPVAELPSSFDAFLAALNKKDRHELRRKLRQAEAAANFSFEEHTAPDDIAGHFDRFLELMRQSRDEKAEFLDAPTEAFFREAVQAAATAGHARLSAVVLGDDPAAMTWCMENIEETFLYNSGYSPDHAVASLGIVSKALALRSALERGKRRFNFLRGDEDYKFRMGGKPSRVIKLALRQR